jgi:predicted ATP-grasp superfamily ATP-dependent carboligase
MTPPSPIHTPPSIAIVGASTRSAAASALRAGFQPIAADLFADADLRAIATATRISPYPEGLLDWLRAVEPPAWMYTGALENYPELVDQMAWIAPLWGNPGDVLTRVRSPWELAKALGEAGLLFPDTRESPDGLPHDGSWLAKTYQGASGSGVRVWDEERGARSEVNPDSAPACFQKRIDGPPCAAVFVATDGAARLFGVTRQLVGEPWLGAHGFQYAGSIGPWPITDATQMTLICLGNVLADQFELIGLFGVDFILDGEQVWTLEVNPRYTASVEIVERFSGLSAIAAHAAACGSRPNTQRAGASSPPIGAKDAPARVKSLACGKATLFARRDCIISDQFFEHALSEALRTPWPTLADVSPAGTPIDAGRPILTVFAEADCAEVVENRLRERVAEIEQVVYRTFG